MNKNTHQTDHAYIISIIQKRLASGLTDEQIRANLINLGYSDQAIDGLIDAARKEPAPSPVNLTGQKPKEKNGPRKKWWQF